jgi:hypothetical protein
MESTSTIPTVRVRDRAADMQKTVFLERGGNEGIRALPVWQSIRHGKHSAPGAAPDVETSFLDLGGDRKCSETYKV